MYLEKLWGRLQRVTLYFTFRQDWMCNSPDNALTSEPSAFQPS